MKKRTKVSQLQSMFGGTWTYHPMNAVAWTCDDGRFVVARCSYVGFPYGDDEGYAFSGHYLVDPTNHTETIVRFES